MPKPVLKTEDVLREHQILDAVRADVNLVIADYRRRMLNAIPALIDEFRDEMNRGNMPAIDAEYRDHIREAIGRQAAAISSGQPFTLPEAEGE
jgi:hypothetical protein